MELVVPLDTLPFHGHGTRTNYTGMVWSGFRRSDDAFTFGYLIPANMFAVIGEECVGPFDYANAAPAFGYRYAECCAAL